MMFKFLLAIGLLFSFSSFSFAEELPPHKAECDQKSNYNYSGAMECSSGQIILVNPTASVLCDFRYSTIPFDFDGLPVVSCIKR
jgi:hypothetical protein